MEDWRDEIWERANLFAAKNGRSLIGQLGYGYDGNVFATERQSAIKVLRFQRHYERERDVYLRLESRSIVEVAGFSVPQLIHHDDHLWVVEMGIVSPPFVLDFAGVYLDQRPDYLQALPPDRSDVDDCTRNHCNPNNAESESKRQCEL